MHIKYGEELTWLTVTWNREVQVLIEEENKDCEKKCSNYCIAKDELTSFGDEFFKMGSRMAGSSQVARVNGMSEVHQEGPFRRYRPPADVTMPPGKQADWRQLCEYVPVASIVEFDRVKKGLFYVSRRL